MISLEMAAALAAMAELPPEGVMNLDALVKSFEPTSFEWMSDRGLYLIDRFAPGYAAEWLPGRSSDTRIEIAVREATGQLEWPTAKAAMRACVHHYVLMQEMGARRAADYISRLTVDHYVRDRGTHPGLAPVAGSPAGAWR